VNCQQAQKLLPLYGSELERRRQHQLAAHVESCTNCAAELSDYRLTNQLLLELTPPRIHDDVYNEIRRQVWRKIEAEETRLTIASVLANWFAPRALWAVAASLLLVVLAATIYLISNRPSVTTKSSVARAGAIRPLQKFQPENRDANALALPNKLVVAAAAKPLRQRRNAVRVERNPLVANIADTRRSLPPRPAAENSQSPAELNRDNNIRMEIQTSNPNIRIIWLPNSEMKRQQNSKGI
jgi:hypothetical protein